MFMAKLQAECLSTPLAYYYGVRFPISNFITALVQPDNKVVFVTVPIDDGNFPRLILDLECPCI